MEDRRPTIQEEAGLGPEWEPLDTVPIIPGQPNVGVPPSNPTITPPGAYFSGSIPTNMQHPANFEKTALPSAFADSSPLMPVSISGNPFNNAAISSIVKTSTPKPTPPAPTIDQLFEINGQDLGHILYINGFAI